LLKPEIDVIHGLVRDPARFVAMSVHETARRGFAGAAQAYEESRPTYPDEALRWLATELRLGPGRTVVDLAAGTGKLTRLLTPTGATVVAVEPVDEMRDALRRLTPEAEARAGTAELPDPERRGVLDRARDIGADQPDRFPFPYTTEIELFDRR
jgi:SAM-dependent methyltransferase